MEHVHSTPMAGTTVLVTGATSGIGKATALGLATMGAHLAITGRNPQRTESAAREIRAAGGEQVDVFVADLSSQAEVRRLATEILQQLPRINVLVNNVGAYWDSRHVTADGLEHTFALNHLAPFLLTNLLLERLKQSAPARVVTVASHAQAMGRMDFDDLQGERSYSGARAYNQSKLANVMFTYELAGRLRGTSVTANALHPGVVRTAFGAEDPAGFQRLLIPFLRPFLKTPAQGAATSIHVASAPDIEPVSAQVSRTIAVARSSWRFTSPTGTRCVRRSSRDTASSQRSFSNWAPSSWRSLSTASGHTWRSPTRVSCSSHWPDDRPRGTTARAYGVYDARRQVAKRALFVIDPLGKIVWSAVFPDAVGSRSGRHSYSA